jgi:hypothetical protein
MSDSYDPSKGNGYDPKAWDKLWGSTDENGNDTTENAGVSAEESSGAQTAADSGLALQKAENDALVAEHKKAWDEQEAARVEGRDSTDQTNAGITGKSVAPAVAVVIAPQENPLVSEKPDSPLSFRDAFKQARAAKGSDGVFEWTDASGKTTSYSTRLASEAKKVAPAVTLPPASAPAPRRESASPVAAAANPPNRDTTPKVVASGTYAGQRDNGQRGPVMTNYMPTPEAPDNLPMGYANPKAR